MNRLTKEEAENCLRSQNVTLNNKIETQKAIQDALSRNTVGPFDSICEFFEELDETGPEIDEVDDLSKKYGL